MMTSSRLVKLQQKMAQSEVEAIFISQPENRYYLSGFSGSAGFLLITAGNRILATDSRYTEQAKTEAPDFEIFPISHDVSDWFARLAGELNLKQLGFESGHITPIKTPWGACLTRFLVLSLNYI